MTEPHHATETAARVRAVKPPDLASVENAHGPIQDLLAQPEALTAEAAAALQSAGGNSAVGAVLAGGGPPPPPDRPGPNVQRSRSLTARARKRPSGPPKSVQRQPAATVNPADPRPPRIEGLGELSPPSDLDLTPRDDPALSTPGGADGGVSSADGLSGEDGGFTPADGGLTPADGGLTPTDGASTPTDGGFTPADGASTPTDGGFTPADGGFTPADGPTDEDLDGGFTPADGPTDDEDLDGGSTPADGPTDDEDLDGGSTPADGPAVDAEEGAAEGEDPAGPGASDLVCSELAEHERWGAVGAAQSINRASFIAERVGAGTDEGAVTGFATGAVLGFGTAAAGRLLARRLPIPIVGSIIGGAISTVALWDQLITKPGETWGKVAAFGEGETGYETAANTIESIVTVLDVAGNIVDFVGLICGVIAAAAWLGVIPSFGASSPIAVKCTAIALKCALIAGVLALVKMTLQPLVVLFRALHTYTSDADPEAVADQGANLYTAGQAMGASLGGFVGSRAGAAAGDKAGGRIADRLGRRDIPTVPVGPPPPEPAVVARPPSAADNPYAPPGPSIISPHTGAPAETGGSSIINPSTGQPVTPTGGSSIINPHTGQPVTSGQSSIIDPNTGQPAAPTGGSSIINPHTGQPATPAESPVLNPHTSAPASPSTQSPILHESGTPYAAPPAMNPADVKPLTGTATSWGADANTAATGGGLVAQGPGEPVTTPVQPTYPQPPGTAADIEEYRLQAAGFREIEQEARADASTEQCLADEYDEEASQLSTLEQTAQKTAEKRAEHQAEVDTKKAANASKLEKQPEGAAQVADAGNNLTGVNTLIPLLTGWMYAARGAAAVMGIFSSSAAAKCSESASEAERFIEQLDEIKATIAAQRAAAPAQAAQAAEEKATIEGVETQGQETDDQAALAEQGAAEMGQSAAEESANAQANRSRAESDAAEAASAAEDSDQKAETLESQLESWANEHRAARQSAVEQMCSTLEDQGYEVMSRPQ